MPIQIILCDLMGFFYNTIINISIETQFIYKNLIFYDILLIGFKSMFRKYCFFRPYFKKKGR